MPSSTIAVALESKVEIEESVGNDFVLMMLKKFIGESGLNTVQTV